MSQHLELFELGTLTRAIATALFKATLGVSDPADLTEELESIDKRLSEEMKRSLAEDPVPFNHIQLAADAFEAARSGTESAAAIRH